MWLRGFYPDGYDKEKNVIFEYDETYHNNSSVKLRDSQRERIIIDTIKPDRFLRYNEDEDKLYDCETQTIIPI